MGAISKNLALPSGSTLPPFPLKHPRIGYKSIATRDNVIASTAAAGFPAEGAVNSLTYESWKPETLPATWTVDAGEAVDADYVGIGSHSFATDRCDIQVQYSLDDVNWITFKEYAPATGDALMFVSDTTITARYWRINIDGAEPPTVGVIYIGEALAMQRPIYGGHAPITLNRTSKTIGNMSDGGNILGVTKIRKGNKSNYEFKNLTAQWYRDFFDPFAKIMTVRGYFIAWNPAEFPFEVGYGISKKEVSPSNQGQRDLMEVSFSLEGHTNG